MAFYALHEAAFLFADRIELKAHSQTAFKRAGNRISAREKMGTILCRPTYLESYIGGILK